MTSRKRKADDAALADIEEERVKRTKFEDLETDAASRSVDLKRHLKLVRDLDAGKESYKTTIETIADTVLSWTNLTSLARHKVQTLTDALLMLGANLGSCSDFYNALLDKVETRYLGALLDRARETGRVAGAVQRLETALEEARKLLEANSNAAQADPAEAPHDSRRRRANTLDSGLETPDDESATEAAPRQSASTKSATTPPQTKQSIRGKEVAHQNTIRGQGKTQHQSKVNNEAGDSDETGSDDDDSDGTSDEASDDESDESDGDYVTAVGEQPADHPTAANPVDQSSRHQFSKTEAARGRHERQNVIPQHQQRPAHTNAEDEDSEDSEEGEDSDESEEEADVSDDEDGDMDGETLCEDSDSEVSTDANDLPLAGLEVSKSPKHGLSAHDELQRRLYSMIEEQHGGSEAFRRVQLVYADFKYPCFELFAGQGSRPDLQNSEDVLNRMMLFYRKRQNESGAIYCTLIPQTNLRGRVDAHDETTFRYRFSRAWFWGKPQDDLGRMDYIETRLVCFCRVNQWFFPELQQCESMLIKSGRRTRNQRRCDAKRRAKARTIKKTANTRRVARNTRILRGAPYPCFRLFTSTKESDVLGPCKWVMQRITTFYDERHRQIIQAKSPGSVRPRHCLEFPTPRDLSTSLGGVWGQPSMTEHQKMIISERQLSRICSSNLAFFPELKGHLLVKQ